MSDQSLEPTPLDLADVLDLTAAKPLADRLMVLRGQPVRLNAAGVERLGALCLQVLLSARLTWAADGAPFQVLNASPAFGEQVARSGAAAFAS